jgi:hypothetical protein
MRKPASAIPVGTQFSPPLIDLKEFLTALCQYSGNRNALQGAIWAPPVHKKRTSIPTSSRTANLPLEAAVQYGLLDAQRDPVDPRRVTYTVTDLAKRLAGLSDPQLSEEFARHILLNRGGLRVVEAIQQMQLDRERGLSSIEVTGDTLAKYLTDQGFTVGEHNTAINSMRLWLAAAGLFKGIWQVDPAIKEKLVGVSDDAIAILAGISPELQAFVTALCRINPSGWYKAAAVRDLAECTFPVRLGRDSLPQLLEPLQAADLIEYRSGGTKGGKSAELKTTVKFDSNVLEPFINTTTKTLDPIVTRYYKTRPVDIYADLRSTNRFKKGRALEAYAIHIMRLLGLRFREWRKQAEETTGRAEIDALFTGVFGGMPTLWQVQCKNTPGAKVDLEDVSKEVGLTPITQATHILLVANADFTKAARAFARQTMRRSPLTIFLIDKSDFEEIRSSPGSLGRILRAQAEQIIESRAELSVWSDIKRS